MFHRQQEWISGLKIKTALWLVTISLATFASIALAGLPWIPVVSVAVAAAAVSVSKITHRLATLTCLSCGHDLTDQPVTAQGIACPGCGAVRSPGLVEIARLRDQGVPPDDEHRA